MDKTSTARPYVISATTKAFQTATPATAEAPRSYLDPSWDAAMENCPGFTFFHGANWGRTLVEAYDFTPACLSWNAPDGRPAYLPFMEVNSWLTGRRGIALPFTDECELLGETEQAFHGIRALLNTHARDRRWKSWEIRGNRAGRGVVPSNPSFWGHTLNLCPKEEEMFSRIHGTARTSVRKAQNQGVAIEFANDAKAVRTFYGLLCKTRQRHGLPPQPFRFFENLRRNILAKGQGWVVLAKHGDQPIAGAIFLHLGTSAVYKFAASDSAFRDLQANNLVLWRAIEWYAKNGFRSIDFGRTSLANEGLRRFKRSWGAAERTIDYIKFDRKADRFVSMKDHASGWHTKFFGILPRPLANLVGAMAYRHLA